MKTQALALLAPFLLAAACGGSDPAVPDGPSPAEALAALRADAAALRAKAEHQDPEVTLQHCLIGVAGHGTPATRSAAEAEALAAEVYARARNGEDFDLLVKNHSDDIYPCLYSLALAEPAPPGAHPRAKVAPPALGDTAWRLEVGELGVVVFDGDQAEPRSPFGWHVVRRLK
ncbi:MAG TPA: peptidylprolyl isomerase [Planctomycetota bacterium]